MSTKNEEKVKIKTEKKNIVASRSLLDNLNQVYDRVVANRCVRLFYLGQLLNKNYKNKIKMIHEQFINKQSAHQHLTGALIFINETVLFHCLEIESFEFLEEFFAYLLEESRLTISENDLNSKTILDELNNSDYVITRSETINNAILSSRPQSHAQFGKKSLFDARKTDVNTNLQAYICKYKVCCVSYDISREFPVWQMRDLSENGTNFLKLYIFFCPCVAFPQKLVF
ncbi:hypothetical protein RFI_21637 [Reticulomyxa filosa]|uniref:Uncharacterized protein n=1 Tax=Reticulomyxa filosa TaxID=46433 RepID=X6MPX9_RETFI|nr:hypothetical protein RFI_21637 [Reticulomyxa filosa]|eukprot:ETO15726.1 hypothetical protein RFI_21637 [Reticulomyxa filosa]